MNNWTFRHIVRTTLILVLILLGFWLLYRFVTVLFISFIAIMMGTVIRPVVNWLYQKGLPRIAGVILIYVLVLAILIGLVFLLVPMVIEQAIEIAAALPVYYQDLRTWMDNSSNLIVVSVNEILPARLPGFEPTTQTGRQILDSADQAIQIVTSAADIFFIATAILLLAYHWTLDGPQDIQSLLRLVPKDTRESIVELISAIENKVGFYIGGQAVLCLVIGSMSLAAYLLIGLPNALLLALAAGLLEAIPMIGPLMGAIPAALIAISIAPSKLVWVIVITLLIQQVENNFLVPRVMRKAVGVNPFVSLLAIFAFSSLFGIAGALMAIPMAAIIQLMLDRFVFQSAELEPEDSTGRDQTSRLRYEAQDLAQALRRQARIKKGGSDSQVKTIDKVMDEIEAITTDLDVLLSYVTLKGSR